MKVGDEEGKLLKRSPCERRTHGTVRERKRTWTVAHFCYNDECVGGAESLDDGEILALVLTGGFLTLIPPSGARTKACAGSCAALDGCDTRKEVSRSAVHYECDEPWSSELIHQRVCSGFG